MRSFGGRMNIIARLSIVDTPHRHIRAHVALEKKIFLYYMLDGYNTFNIFFTSSSFLFNIHSFDSHPSGLWLVKNKEKKIQNCTPRTLNTRRTNWWGVK